jgi:hypothetical protein
VPKINEFEGDDMGGVERKSGVIETFSTGCGPAPRPGCSTEEIKSAEKGN